jgi:hypothetical protein
MLIETAQKFVVDTEVAAKDLIETYRKQAIEKGYVIKKASYEYKTKKAKGEIIAERWVVTIIQTFGSVWEGIE